MHVGWEQAAEHCFHENTYPLCHGSEAQDPRKIKGFRPARRICLLCYDLQVILAENALLNRDIPCTGVSQPEMIDSVDNAAFSGYDRFTTGTNTINRKGR